MTGNTTKEIYNEKGMRPKDCDETICDEKLLRSEVNAMKKLRRTDKQPNA
jgi:hypothetical protein